MAGCIDQQQCWVVLVHARLMRVISKMGLRFGPTGYLMIAFMQPVFSTMKPSETHIYWTKMHKKTHNFPYATLEKRN